MDGRAGIHLVTLGRISSSRQMIPNDGENEKRRKKDIYLKKARGKIGYVFLFLLCKWMEELDEREMIVAMASFCSFFALALV